MRLPWNKKYMEISFHVIITVWILVGMAGLLFWLPDAKNVILQAAGKFLAVFSPLFWAIFFALLLEPLVAFWQREYERRCSLFHRSRIQNRKVGTTITYLSVGLLLFLLGGFLARKIGNTNIEEIAHQINDYICRVGDLLVLLNLKLAEIGILRNVEELLSVWTEQLMQGIESQILRLAHTLPNIGGSLLDILVGGVVAFYFLTEKKRMLSICGELSAVLFGKTAARRIRRLFHEIYVVFAGYLSGQMVDAVSMAVLFSAAFLVVGLPQAILLGVISGFSNLIPYFGAVMAFILAVFAGLLSGTPAKALYASILILLLQQVDSIFIVPRAVGKRVELHPVLVLLSLAVFGRCFGFWGLLFAVPLGALCKNGLLWIYERKKSRRDA